jgi:hypothetical protein
MPSLRPRSLRVPQVSLLRPVKRETLKLPQVVVSRSKTPQPPPYFPAVEPFAGVDPADRKNARADTPALEAAAWLADSDKPREEVPTRESPGHIGHHTPANTSDDLPRPPGPRRHRRRNRLQRQDPRLPAPRREKKTSRHPGPSRPVVSRAKQFPCNISSWPSNPGPAESYDPCCWWQSHLSGYTSGRITGQLLNAY